MHSLCLAVGSLHEQRVVHKGENLHLTILIDHDVIDGVPAVRFIEQLTRRLEDGYGL